MTRGLLLALIGGIISVFLTFATFGAAPLFVVGFYLGSAYAGISASVGALLLLTMPNFGSGSTIYYVAVAGAPALLIIHQALISRPGTQPNTLAWYPPGMIFSWATLYGVFVMACIATYFATTGHTLESVSREFLIKISTWFPENPDLTKAQQDLLSQRWEMNARLASPTFVGFTLSLMFLQVICLATAAQALLFRAGKSLRPSPQYVNLELPLWLLGALVGAFALSLLPGSLGSFGLNAAVFLSTPFFLLGLTVIHTLSRRSLKPGSVLSAFYMGLFLVSVIFKPALAVLVLLGIGEQWLSLRQRFAATGADQEDE